MPTIWNRLTINVSPELNAKIRAAAKADGRPVASWVKRLIEHELARLDNKATQSAAVMYPEIYDAQSVAVAESLLEKAIAPAAAQSPAAFATPSGHRVLRAADAPPPSAQRVRPAKARDTSP